MALKAETARLHETERFGNTVRQLDIAPRLRAVLDETEHPLPYAGEVCVAALREGTQQVECRSRLAECLDLPARIGTSCFVGKCDVIDDIAPIARQFLTVAFLGRRGARLGE